VITNMIKLPNGEFLSQLSGPTSGLYFRSASGLLPVSFRPTSGQRQVYFLGSISSC
jgi:hypothetical protein